MADLPIEATAQRLLDQRFVNRQATKEYIESGNVILHGKLAVLHFDGKMRNEFLPALIPEAAVFLTIEPNNKNPASQIMRLWLGKQLQLAFLC